MNKFLTAHAQEKWARSKRPQITGEIVQKDYWCSLEAARLSCN